MAFSEQDVISKIEVLEDGHLQIRRTHRIFKDDVVVSETFHRYVLPPGADVTQEDPRVQAVARAVWG